MNKLYVIKIGGNIIDDEQNLSSFLTQFAAVKQPKILIHGGGKLATSIAKQLNIPQQLIDGRRITDVETLKVITMVYAGYINKNITAQLQANNCNAIGLCGADGNLIKANKRIHPTIDYGFVGDVETVNSIWLKELLQKNIVPVVAPVTHDGQGQLLNTNADTIAQQIAKSLAVDYEVILIYCFEKKGVLMDANDEDSVISTMNLSSYNDLKEQQVIHSGMIPKADNAFTAVQSGVSKVIIGKAEDLMELISGSAGTTIIHE